MIFTCNLVLVAKDMQMMMYELLTHVISSTNLQGTMIWHLITQAILVCFRNL